jgi:hypothetical protein
LAVNRVQVRFTAFFCENICRILKTYRQKPAREQGRKQRSSIPPLPNARVSAFARFDLVWDYKKGRG